MNVKEKIENQVNTVYKTCASAALSIKEPEIADIDLHVSELNGSLIFLNEMQTQDNDLFFDLERTDALVMMYFQLDGATNFVDDVPFSVPTKHHSLNYLPSFQSRCRAEKNTRLKNLCIKVKPDTILNEWPDELNSERWLRAIEKREPIVTLHESQPMNQDIQFNIRQLIHCPYSGELGNSYRQSLIRLLLIQQFSEFMPAININSSSVQKLPVNRAAVQKLSPSCTASPQLSPDCTAASKLSSNWTAAPKLSPNCTAASKLSSKDIAALNDLKQYLETHFLEDFSLDKLARQAGLNSFKLKYGFRLLFNTPVMKFIDELKMEYARQMLLDNQYTDRFDLSDMLGYNHYSNFSAAFKKHFGESPSSYKKYLSHID